MTQNVPPGWNQEVEINQMSGRLPKCVTGEDIRLAWNSSPSSWDWCGVRGGSARFGDDGTTPAAPHLGAQRRRTQPAACTDHLWRINKVVQMKKVPSLQENIPSRMWRDFFFNNTCGQNQSASCAELLCVYLWALENRFETVRESILSPSPALTRLL